MTAREREEQLYIFRTDPQVNIILISLKCGSLGLNLTCANRVCLMDVWWNPAIGELVFLKKKVFKNGALIGMRKCVQKTKRLTEFIDLDK